LDRVFGIAEGILTPLESRQGANPNGDNPSHPPAAISPGNSNAYRAMRKLKNAELDRLKVEEFREADKSPLVLVLDNIRSLHNIGSVFRTADAFRVEKIYLCGISATPPHKDIYKTALGATDSVSWEYRKKTLALIEELKDHYTCLAVEQAEDATPLHHFSPKPGIRYVLVFGNEVKGVAQEVVSACHGVLEIPQFGTKHSLNVAVSAGVVVWDLWTKLQTPDRENKKP